MVTAHRITALELHNAHRWIPLDEVRELPGNPNLGHTESLNESLERFGWIDGIVIHDGLVVAGNHRYKAARAAGETGLPGYDLTPYPLSAVRRLAASMAHNSTTRAGSNDPDLLAAALEVAETVADLPPSLLSILDPPAGHRPAKHDHDPDPAAAVPRCPRCGADQ